MKVIMSHDYCYAVPSLVTSHLCKKYQVIYKSVYSYLCTCMRNKYPWRSEFVGNFHIEVCFCQWNMFNFREYAGICMSTPSDIFERVKFSLTNPENS